MPHKSSYIHTILTFSGCHLKALSGCLGLYKIVQDQRVNEMLILFCSHEAMQLHLQGETNDASFIVFSAIVIYTCHHRLHFVLGNMLKHQFKQ